MIMKNRRAFYFIIIILFFLSVAELIPSLNHLFNISGFVVYANIIGKKPASYSGLFLIFLNFGLLTLAVVLAEKSKNEDLESKVENPGDMAKQLVLVRLFDTKQYETCFDRKGNRLFASPVRPTIHFSLNYNVSSHTGGDWTNENYALLVPFEDAMNENPSNILSIRTEDTYFAGYFRIPKNAVLLNRKEGESFEQFSGRIKDKMKEMGFTPKENIDSVLGWVGDKDAYKFLEFRKRFYQAPFSNDIHNESPWHYASNNAYALLVNNGNDDVSRYKMITRWYQSQLSKDSFYDIQDKYRDWLKGSEAEALAKEKIGKVLEKGFESFEEIDDFLKAWLSENPSEKAKKAIHLAYKDSYSKSASDSLVSLLDNLGKYKKEVNKRKREGITKIYYMPQEVFAKIYSEVSGKEPIPIGKFIQDYLYSLGSSSSAWKNPDGKDITFNGNAYRELQTYLLEDFINRDVEFAKDSIELLKDKKHFRNKYAVEDYNSHLEQYHNAKARHRRLTPIHPFLNEWYSWWKDKPIHIEDE